MSALKALVKLCREARFSVSTLIWFSNSNYPMLQQKTSTHIRSYWEIPIPRLTGIRGSVFQSLTIRLLAQGKIN